MKKIYSTPKVRTVKLDTCSLMAGSISGGGQGTPGEHGGSKRRGRFLDGDFFEEDME